MSSATQSIIRQVLSTRLSNLIESVNIESNQTTGGYSCKVLSINVNVRQEESDEETRSLRFVMKYLEDTNDEVLKLSFTKEVLMYEAVMPEYIRIQKELSIDKNLTFNIFPDFFGSNLHSSDSTIMFLMKDLRTSGYVTAEIMKELDSNHTELVIDKLAHFHALGIKLKETNPNIFFDDFKDIIKPALRNMGNPNKTNIDSEFIKKIQAILAHNKKLNRFTKKVVSLIKKINENPLPDSKEPFATLLHNDLWKNNILFRYDNNDCNHRKPLDVKFIDFQFVVYNSPIRDLVYFVFTSTSVDVQKRFQTISSYYYNRFINYLSLLEYKNINQFNIDRYSKEIKCFAWTKFKHILLTMLLTTEETTHNPTRDEKLLNLCTCFESNGWFE